VRVIAATHQDLEQRVRQGLFREDLFHRLNVIRLRLPSLRERREDIPLLARHFLQKCARDLGVEVKRLSEATVRYLSAQEFPGNVRQLENLCHWLTVMAPSLTIEIKDLPPEVRSDPAAASANGWIPLLEKEVEALLNRGQLAIMNELSRSFEKALIAKALAHTGGRRIEASQLLGLGRNTLTRKIQELGLDHSKERDPA
jgi:two-component system nitrogen regulation response regulator GlnG